MLSRSKNRARRHFEPTAGWRISAMLGMVALATAQGAAQAGDWKTVANSATIIPGTSQTFSSFNQPSINVSCLLTFRARGRGPSEPPRGVFWAEPCDNVTPTTIFKMALNNEVVPSPNNTGATFNEFPAFSRIDPYSRLIATRAQTTPTWVYSLPDGTETRVGTAGLYYSFAPLPYLDDLKTGMTLLGAVPGFSYFSVPGFPGTRFDQFPGAPVPFGNNWLAFKGNFTDGVTSRTGVYARKMTDGGTESIIKIADTTTSIPGGTTTFGSTAPPSAAWGRIVFVGLDNEEAPTEGGIYLSRLRDPTNLQSIVKIGDQVPGMAPGNTFNRIGEALSYDGRYLTFWGAWGERTRRVTLYCPVDGNAALITACIEQCPAVDSTGLHYCTRKVPRWQGIFKWSNNGVIRLVARAAPYQMFQDFLFWVFSGRPPATGGDADDIEEPPRWRSSAFTAVTPNTGGVGWAVAFKASKSSGEAGIYMRRGLEPVQSVVLLGDDASAIDSAAPAGSKVTSVGIERDGFRNCRLALTAGFLNETTSESWAGVYLNPNGCGSAAPATTDK